MSLAVAVGTSVKIFRTDKDRKFYTAALLEGAKGLVRDVSWANGSMRGFDMIATASKDGFVRIYELHTYNASTNTVANFPTTAEKSERRAPPVLAPPPVTSVRSGIGAGLAGGTRGKRDDGAGAPGAIKQEVKLAAELAMHGPWRVNWSPMADLLVASGDDGVVRLWKKAADGKWLEAAAIDATKDR